MEKITTMASMTVNAHLQHRTISLPRPIFWLSASLPVDFVSVKQPGYRNRDIAGCPLGKTHADDEGSAISENCLYPPAGSHMERATNI